MRVRGGQGAFVHVFVYVHGRNLTSDQWNVPMSVCMYVCVCVHSILLLIKMATDDLSCSVMRASSSLYTWTSQSDLNHLVICRQLHCTHHCYTGV